MRHLFQQLEIQPRTLEIATDKKRIKPRHAPDDANVTRVSPRASVRAPGNTHTDAAISHAVLLQQRIESIDHLRMHPFRFRQRQPAGRQRGAGQRILRHRRQNLGQHHLVAAQQSLHLGAITGTNVGQQHILLRRHDKAGRHTLRDRAQRRAQLRALRKIRDAPRGHRHAQPPFSVALLVPPQQIGYDQL